jgi:hypothetical protein
MMSGAPTATRQWWCDHRGADTRDARRSLPARDGMGAAHGMSLMASFKTMTALRETNNPASGSGVRGA